MDSLTRGRPYPLGAHWDGAGVNFAVFSEHARLVELGVERVGEWRFRALPSCTDGVWHGYLPHAAAGTRYGFRVLGPAAPDNGHRFDASRLLLDPAGRGLAGRFDWQRLGDTESAGGLVNVVIDDRFDWRGDVAPATPLADSLLYEIHVRGATMTHPEVPLELRGRYAGLAAPAMLEHYRRLGVTALNLLPVQAFIDEKRLVQSGLRNYWGYNPIAFSVPEARYASADGQAAVDEFKSMVRALHAEGIEVILDVVFNHTAETDEAGPVLSFRGLDNAVWYRLDARDRARYENYSGCGNTVNLAHPRVLQVVMDALRYWVGEMHVDGFRFDLAASLTRDSAFLEAVAQDPMLARAKLIAEPWDLGPDGYRLGRFPGGWSEWNDRYRNAVRAYWLTGNASAGGLAQRLAGSSELFRAGGRQPQSGVNFIATHDGFTLHDLVSYAKRHNEANGEGNRDGQSDNHSTNCGVEGDTDDPAVFGQRRRLQRALLATLFVSQGVPMLQAGDELGRSQRGNNNAYCQDNALAWIDWSNADLGLVDFVARLADLRRRYPQLRRLDWLSGEPDDDGNPDVLWWHPQGRAMRTIDWNGGERAFAARFSGTAHGEATLLLLFNPGGEARDFVLPDGSWAVQLSSADPDASGVVAGGKTCRVAAHSVDILAERGDR